MACSKPIEAWQTPDGSIVWRFSLLYKRLLLPCGQCTRCRLELSRQWATRCMQEAQMHNANCSVLLTYNDTHLPKDNSLHHRHFQLFFKRLRKFYAPLEIKYYMGGEYGDENGRPHYHACLFGIDFHDKTYHRKSPAGSKIYISKTLDKLWGMGNCGIGALNFEMAAYIARYILKKVNGDTAALYYQRFDPITGEIWQVKPEYNESSNGIGKNWLHKYWNDVYPHGHIIVRGNKANTPRYYDKILKRTDPETLEKIKERREKEGKLNAKDNTPKRLAVKEAVAKANSTRFNRKGQFE